MTSEERRRIAELEKENRELRRANEILKSASAFLGGGGSPGCLTWPISLHLIETARG